MFKIILVIAQTSNIMYDCGIFMGGRIDGFTTDSRLKELV